METVFTIRLNKELSDSLSLLANVTHRSKASTIRWLISKASNEIMSLPIEDNDLGQLESQTKKRIELLDINKLSKLKEVSS